MHILAEQEAIDKIEILSEDLYIARQHAEELRQQNFKLIWHKQKLDVEYLEYKKDNPFPWEK